MSGLNFRISSMTLADTKKRLDHLERKARQAIYEALERTGTGLKTDAVRETKQRYHLSASAIREALIFKRAKNMGSTSTATLIVRGHSKRISDYKVTGSGENLKVAVKREGGMKTLKTAFLRDYNGRKIVLWRPPGVSGPPRRVFSPSVPQAMKNEETLAAMEKGARKRFNKRLDQNIDRLLRGTWSGYEGWA